MAANTRRETVASILDDGVEAIRESRFSRQFDALRLAEEKTGGADAVEIAFEGEVVAARPGRSKRWQKPCGSGDNNSREHPRRSRAVMRTCRCIAGFDAPSRRCRASAARARWR